MTNESDAPVTRPNLDKLIAYAEIVASKGVQTDDGFTYQVPAASLVDSQDVIRELVAALAAERARADQAEQRIAEAADLLPREPYYTRDIGPAYPEAPVDEAFELLTAPTAEQ